MSSLSQEEARDFITTVREDNGGLTAEDKDYLTLNRPSVLRLFQNIREKLGSSIKTVVKHLYSTETRFLYELIQNAEDNSYSVATTRGDEPFMTFKLYPDRILVDSNEDGFMEENIKAICSIGDSTKVHSAGYIGEKGIGFKSVFKIAKKVHIQSGPFSFAFLHTRENDDTGLGMITPYDENAEDLPMGVRTRMTLMLIDPNKFEELASEFRDVPDTFLMFLSRLKKLTIEIHQPDRSPMTTRYSKRETQKNGIYTTFLTKTSREGEGNESTSEQRYHTIKSDLHDLPSDESRKDKQGNNIDWATVVLGFPVNELDEPVLKQQHTYSFLPLRRVGFKFLIQADFVTQANREDVVHSKRNQAVLKGVAKAFSDAVAMFCNRSLLRYQWMRYLPEESISDTFWGSLWTLVREKLEKIPVLEPWSGDGLYKPPELQRLSEKALAADGSPLLPDLEDAEIYLSPKYREADFKILKRLGTSPLKFHKFLDRLEADLSKPNGSKWRNMKENADWRSRICRLLSEHFDDHLFDNNNRLRNFALIPLGDGRWVNGVSGTGIFFHKTDNVPIPTDLGLDLVHHLAVENPDWTRFLSTSGVVNCPPHSVISAIQGRYNARNVYIRTVYNAVSHVRYLYWFLPEDRLSFNPQVRLMNQHDALLRREQYLYFPDKVDDYSPSNLFQQEDQLPGYAVNFLHRFYLSAVRPEVIRSGWSWTKWLENVVGVRRIPELRAQDHEGLSKEFKYIIEHRSNRLLGLLKREWAHYGLQIKGAVQQELRDCLVLLENGQKGSLQKTFLPFPKLKRIAAELGVANEYPFIILSEPLQDKEMLDWIFIKDLHIEIEDNLGFYLSVLDEFKRVNHSVLKAPSVGDQAARIYQNIQSKCGEDIDRVRDVFKQPVVLIPPSNKSFSAWTSTTNCVWNGPQWLKSKYCLKADVYLKLEHFFTSSLAVPDASLKDVIADLVLLKNHSEAKNDSEYKSPTEPLPNLGTYGVPFQYILMEEGNGLSMRFQSISCTKDHRDKSFEELRLLDYNMGTRPFQYILMEEGNGLSMRFQSISCTKEHRDHSFEELRLLDYNKGRRPFRSRRSGYKSEEFGGLELTSGKIIEEAEKRYDYLSRNCVLPFGATSENLKAMRSSFEDSALIYIPTEDTWYPPSKCVWVESSVKIPWKASIADTYPSKKMFFTTILKVSEPTVEMYIESLKAGAEGKTSVAQLKETMALICRLGVRGTNLSGLVDAKVLPVRLTTGLTGFASASSKNKTLDFAIVENLIHWNAFWGKIAVLDFTLEEIRDTRPLLLAMGLEERFSSKLVKEVTDVNGGFQEHKMTRILRNKSQALVRCAFHFASADKGQDVASLYRKFKRAMIYVSDNIKLSLRIVQNGQSIESASSRANFHLEESEGCLRLYLPKDEVERDVCFEYDLPRRLCKFLSITDPGAPAIIGGVFRKDSPVVIVKILENAGVCQVGCDFVALDVELGPSDVESDNETLVEPVSNSRLSTPKTSSLSAYTPSSWPRRREGQTGIGNTENTRDEVLPKPSYVERQEIQDVSYKRVLENAVNVARLRANSGPFESMGFSPRGPVAVEALPQDTIREAFATRSLERDFKLGAAGELYMFEYLKGLKLPGFGLESWKSAIRDRVKIHIDYHNLVKDNDRNAIADIEYCDVSRKFTQFLTEKGYLAQEIWDSVTPTYHIEVKTTTSSDWQEPFFMSKAQERHVQDNRIEDGKSRLNIYMICRLFNLGKGEETGLQIYLDPETKRRNRELEFTAHTWAVKPLVQSSMLGEQGITKDSAARTTERAATAANIDHESRTDDAGKRPTVRIFDSTSDISSNIKKFLASSGTKSSEIMGPPSERSPKSDDSGSGPITPSKNSTTQPPPGSGLFGSRVFSSMGNVVSDSNTMSNNDASKSPSEGLFGSKTIQKGGVFGSTTAPAGGIFSSTTTPTGGLFGSNATTSSSGVYPRGDTAKPPSSGIFGSNTIASTSQTSQTTLKTGLFGSTSKVASPDSGVSRPLPSSLFGSSAGSSGNDVSRATTPKGSGVFGSDAGSRSTNVSPSSGKSQLPLPFFTPFGSNTFLSGNAVSRASTPKSSPFDPSSKSSLHDSPMSKAPLPGLFDSTSTPTSNISVAGTSGGFAGFTSSSITPKSDTSKSPSLGIFRAPATSSNTSGGSLFGSNAGPSSHHTPRPRSTGSIFDLPTKSDISREKSPSTSNSSGFGSSSSPRSKIPATTIYFGANNGSASDNGFPNVTKSRPFEVESIPWTSISKAAGSTFKTPKATTTSTPSNSNTSHQNPITPIFSLTGAATDTMSTLKPPPPLFSDPSAPPPTTPTTNTTVSALSLSLTGPPSGFRSGTPPPQPEPQPQTASSQSRARSRIRIRLPHADNDNRRPSRSLPPPLFRDPTVEEGGK